MTPPPPLTRDQLRDLDHRLVALAAATSALLCGWHDSHGTPLRTAPPTAQGMAAELRALADILDSKPAQTAKPQ